MTKLADSTDALPLILDLENVISEIGALAYKKEIVLEDIEKITQRKLKGNVLIADDSGLPEGYSKSISNKWGFMSLTV